MRGRASVLGGALVLAGANLAMQGVSMLFRVWLTRRVGAAGMGLVQLVLSVGGLAMTAGVSGARVAALYLCAEELGLGRSRGVARVLEACLRYGLAAGMAAGLALILGSSLLARRWIGGAAAAGSLRLLGLFLPADCLGAILSGWFTASGRVGQLVGVQALERGASIALTVLLLRAGADACRAVILGGGLASLLGLATMSLICLRALPKPDPAIPAAKRLLRLCLPLALGDYLRAGLSTASHLLIPRGLARSGGSAEAAVAAYGVIHGMVFPVLFFPAALLYALADLLIPELSRLRVQGKTTRIRTLADRCFRLGAVFACACAGTLHLLSAPLGRLLFRNEQAGYYLALFAPLIVVLYLDAVTDGLLKGLGQQLYCVQCSIFTSALEVAGLLVLLPRLGVAGYFLTFAATRLINYLLGAGRLLRVTGAPLPMRFCLRLTLCLGACAALTRQWPWCFLPVFCAALFLSRTLTAADLRAAKKSPVCFDIR